VGVSRIRNLVLCGRSVRFYRAPLRKREPYFGVECPDVHGNDWINNSLSVTSRRQFRFTDVEAINTTITGQTGSGTSTVSVPSAGITGVILTMVTVATRLPASIPCRMHGHSPPHRHRVPRRLSPLQRLITSVSARRHHRQRGRPMLHRTYNITGVPSTTTFTCTLQRLKQPAPRSERLPARGIWL